MLHTLAQLFAETKIKPGQLPKVTDTTGDLHTILNIAISTIGALSLLVIVISGFRYITAAGSEQKTASAKNGIIYALIGLLVAIVAESIVVFVGNRLLP